MLRVSVSVLFSVVFLVFVFVVLKDMFIVMFLGKLCRVMVVSSKVFCD